MSEKGYLRKSITEVVYRMNNAYLAELCTLIYEKHQD